MIGTLVRIDPVRRLLPMLLVGGFVAGLVLRGVRVAIPGGLPAGSIGAAALVVMLLAATAWGTAVACLMMTGIQSRGSLLSLGLPLPARTIWIARMASIALAATIPVGTMTLVAAVGWDSTGGASVHAATLGLGFRLLASLLLPVAIVQVTRPDLRTLPWSRGQVLRLMGALVVSWAVLFVPVPAVSMAGIAFLVTGLLAARTLRRIPPTFSSVGNEIAPAQAIAASTSTRDVPSKGGLSRRVLARVLVSHAAAWFILPVLVLYGFQTLLVYHEGSDVLLVLFFPMIWIPFVALHSMSRIGPFDPLPIPRRRLFRWIVLPSVAAYVAGLALYAPVSRWIPDPPAPVRLYANGVRAPNEFWEFAAGGTPPRIVAPWGESHTPRTRTVVPGLDLAVYFPFAAPDEASPRYFAWQARRALAAVYGGDPASVAAPAEDDPLVRRMENRSALRSSENLIPAEGTDSVQQERTLLVFGFGPLLFWLGFGWMGMHPRLRGRTRGVLLALGLAVPVTTVVLTEIAAIASGIPAAPLSIAASVTARHVADALPLGVGALLGGVAVAGVAVYLLLRRAFERFEAPRRPAKTMITAWKASD